jgi:hypothetical protein
MRATGLVIAAGAFTTASIIAAYADIRGNATTLLLAATAVALAIVCRTISRSLPTPAMHSGASIGLLVAAGIVLVGGAVAVQFRGELSPIAFPITAGVASTLVSAILTMGWLDGGFRRSRSALDVFRWVVVSLVVGVAGFVGFVALTAVVSGEPFGRPPLLAATAATWLAGQVLWWLGELWPPDYCGVANDAPEQPVS